MSVFLARVFIILGLFALSAFLVSLTANSALAIPIWFTAVSTWTLILGFRKALAINIPFLIFADVLWDGTVGAIFLGGFLLATATTYTAARVEAQSYLLKTAFHTFLISFFAALVIWLTLAFPDAWFSFALLAVTLKIWGWQALVTVISIVPISEILTRVEAWFDQSYRDQWQKIR